MIRKIIEINEENCNGCGLCTDACHEGAISIVNGKAKLIRDDYCDGLGDCLPTCPTGAITFIEREAAAYNEKAVMQNKQKLQEKSTEIVYGCPGALTYSQLQQWPVQIQLVPVNAPYFENADLLIAADCTAYAYGNFHSEFMREKVTLIGCPKLDSIDYREKLTAIIRENKVKSVTIVRMEVPCCGGIEYAVKQAVQESGNLIPCKCIIISTDGRMLES